MKNVLITGITGFVGSALWLRLLNDTSVRKVVGLSRRTYLSKQRNGKRLVMRQGDIRDIDTLREIISMEEIDTVFHLAASAIVRSSARDPLTCYDINVNGTLRVLEAVRQVDPDIRLIVASSDKAYGDSKPPYREDTPLRPTNTYDASKAAADLITQAYTANYGMNVATTRACNIYGIGDPNPSRLVPATIERILAGDRPRIYRNALNMVREFIYIEDVVDAYLAIADSTHVGPINIGTDSVYAIRQAVNTILNIGANAFESTVQGYNVIEREEDRFKEISKQHTNSTLVRRLGWTPTHSFRDGITKMFEYAIEQRRIT